MDPKTKEELDNRSNQLNPNNDAYWSSRGIDDDDDNKKDNYIEDDSSGYDDNESFYEEWVPQDAW
ncbi:hypothetical protein [Paracnuella aquatica]|uniref:hypothetical protein n=1 Tax=Paracnuella aquatica TaxID=2268757 RepID=UPI000DEFE612|nr:hypothetical protein [Paracnuella aquatica]RPD43567.1 hypothetical protein DRJ53_19705 [Paracnuella aquatica]